MTKDEFLTAYHYYQVRTPEEAQKEADHVNAIGIDDHKAVVVHFPGLGYCLMLDIAAEEIVKLFGGLNAPKLHPSIEEL